MLFPLQFLDTLLLTRQVKSYAFLANSEVTVDNVDDSQQFKYTQVCVRECALSGMDKEGRRLTPNQRQSFSW